MDELCDFIGSWIARSALEEAPFSSPMAPVADPNGQVMYSFIVPVSIPPNKPRHHVSDLVVRVRDQLSHSIGGDSWQPGSGSFEFNGQTEREPHLKAMSIGSAKDWQTHARVILECLRLLQRELLQKAMYFGVGGEPDRLFNCLTPSESAALPDFSDFGAPDTRALLSVTGEIGIAKLTGALKVSVGCLPRSGEYLFGREEPLRQLDDAWSGRRANVVVLVAWAGVGKTALINEWLNGFRKDGYYGARRVFGWSFYTQGVDGAFGSADPFFHAALSWFGASLEALGSSWDRAERLSGLIRTLPSVLILDGLEPLQYPIGSPDEGRLRDQALAIMLRDLAGHNPGLTLISTRLRVTDLTDFESSGAVIQLDLDHISPPAGAQLLRSLGVIGTDDELLAASTKLHGHALSLTLLAGYVREALGGDISQLGSNVILESDLKDGPHARRILEAYDRWFGASAALECLRALSFFDRPVERSDLESLRKGPIINELTGHLVVLGEQEMNVQLAALRRAHLILPQSIGDRDRLDLHPLVRQHYAEALSHRSPAVWRQGHQRLFTHFKADLVQRPETPEEIGSVLTAARHGCLGGEYSAALDLFTTMAMRGEESYAANRLGLGGDALALLSQFFEDNEWSRPTEQLTAEKKLIIHMEAGRLLTMVYGYAHYGVEHTYAAAIKIAKAIRDGSHLLEATLGLCRYYRLRGDLARSGRLAQELRQLTEAVEPKASVVADRAQASYHFYRGEFGASRRLAESGMKAPFDPARAYALAQLDVNEPCISCFGYSALCSYLMGEIRRGDEANEEALCRARELKHPHTLVIATFIDTLLAQFVEHGPKVLSRAGRLVALCEERGIHLWRDAARILFYWARSQAGVERGALDEMLRAIESWRRSGARLFEPYWLGLAADAALRAGRPREAVKLVEEAVDTSRETGETWWDADLARLEGDLLFASGETAESCVRLEGSVSAAGRQGAHLLGARATRSLAQRLGLLGRGAEIRTRLQVFIDAHAEASMVYDLPGVLQTISG